MVKDLSVDLCGIRLKNPVVPASGTFGFGLELAGDMDLNVLGGISLKGTTREARYGNPTPRIAECEGGMINSVGLQNPGIDVLVGEKVPALRKVYDGWQYPAEWETEGMWLESPKLFKRGGWYYLVSAEGGTAGPPTSHMVVVARSKSALGPWENSPYNPMVHTYSADEAWWSKGHGTIFDDADGNWYVVYHAYRNGFDALIATEDLAGIPDSLEYEKASIDEILVYIAKEEKNAGHFFN